MNRFKKAFPHFFLTSTICSLLIGCSSPQPQVSSVSEPTKEPEQEEVVPNPEPTVYNDEIFSFTIPEGWHVVEHTTNPVMPVDHTIRMEPIASTTSPTPYINVKFLQSSWLWMRL